MLSMMMIGLQMLFHGHSYTGNPLGCAAGLASLDVFEQEKTLSKIEAISKAQALLSRSVSRKMGLFAMCDSRVLYSLWSLRWESSLVISAVYAMSCIASL
jgi:adenosylmethionine-8-amino-7-oxononanoate aminotransferase